MPEDTPTTTGSAPENNNSNLGKYLMIFLVAFAILWAVGGRYLPGYVRGNASTTDAVPEDVPDSGVSSNQIERAPDVLLYNEAIDKKDKKLCERITDGSLKTDCLKFFAVNGI